MRAEIIEPDRRSKPGKGKGKPRKGATPTAIAAYTFRPGQSGNPGGYNGMHGVVLGLARNYSPQATSHLIDIIQDTDNDPRVRTVAIGMILERAWGKPKEVQDDKAAGPPDLGALNAADLAELRRISAKMRGTQDAPQIAPEAPPSAPKPPDEPEPIPVD